MSYSPLPSEPTLNPCATLSDESFAISKKTRTNSAGLRRKARTNKRRPQAGNDTEYPIIVHCHLQWDWVWHRPQQFISRLSRRHRILFIETLPPDPWLATPLVRFRRPEEFSNLTILSLQFPSWRWSDGAYVDLQRRKLVQEFLTGPGQGQFENPVQWFYDPMTVRAFAGQMGEILTVYDCMDELSKFMGAPPEILERETDLLAQADVVFTGGRKLLEAKSQFNGNCHFYGCGVDVDHFGRAREDTTTVPAELDLVQRPVLGYFGVVDERMDYELVADLADANPKWSVVMVGPVMKVDPGMLPRRPNLHFLGQRSYQDLPALCKGFDVCLMPFALNAATEYINPTKALEYMATGRPIISTPVPDVVRNFSAVVRIARTRQEFVESCRQALEKPDGDAIQRGLKMARENTWDSIVAELETHIQKALLKQRDQA